jgi:hypothetical protein
MKINHYVSSWLRIDWLEEHVSTAARHQPTAGQGMHWWVPQTRMKMSKSPMIVVVSHILHYSSHWRVQYDYD